MATMMKTLNELLGPDLWAAVDTDNLPLVKTLMAAQQAERPTLTDILGAAGSLGAVDVAAYCLEDGVMVTQWMLQKIWFEPRLDPVYRYMIEHNAVDINMHIEWCGDMLGLSAHCGRHSLVRFCLEHGGNPNGHQLIEGDRPTLACAAISSDPEMLAILLDGGARLEESGALFQAARWGKLDCVKFLLARGADVDEQEQMYHRTGSPLCKAVNNEHVAVIEELLRAGADVLVKDYRGKTAMELIREKGMDLTAEGKLIMPARQKGETNGKNRDEEMEEKNQRDWKEWREWREEKNREERMKRSKQKERMEEENQKEGPQGKNQKNQQWRCAIM